MRLLIQAEARADTAYDSAYHHKLRGRMWRALEGTEYGESHGDGDPGRFCYSNPIPPHDMREGDERTILVSSPREELLAEVASDLKDEPELNVGEMPFRVTDLDVLTPDVGEPGTRGTLETGTGVLVRIPPRKFEAYGIDEDPEGDTAAFWRPAYSMAPLRTQLRNNLDRKHGLHCPDHLPGPSQFEEPLFDSYELIKTFAIPLTVTQGETRTVVLSKWELGYEVRDDHHRRHLNLALDTGIGERNGLGLGFMNVTEKHPPRRRRRESSAHA